MIKSEDNIMDINEIREKLGISPKKYKYRVVEGELIIFKVVENDLYSA